MTVPRDRPVWVPAFHCGVEVEAIRAAGFTPAFYEVTAGLNADLDDLLPRLDDNPGPVVVIHYFGFPDTELQEIARRCIALRVPLVEDCCHALFSRIGDRAVGTYGHIGIFSFRKTLGTVDGGFLTVRADRLLAETGVRHFPPPRRPRARWPYLVMARRILASSGLVPARTRKAWLWNMPDADGGSVSHPNLRRPSLLAELAFRGADPEHIVAARRQNWLALDRNLRDLPGYTPVHSALPVGACPLGLVIRVRRRDTLAAALIERAVEPYVFGARTPGHPDPGVGAHDAVLRNELLCLPVHHELTPPAITRIVAAVRASW